MRGISRHTAETPETNLAAVDEMSEVIDALTKLTLTFTALLEAVDPEMVVTHWKLLRLLNKEGKMRPYEAALKIRITRQHTFQAGKKLEKLGYLRYEVVDLKRAVYMEITDKGINVVDQVDAKLLEASRDLTMKLPKVSPRAVKAALRIIVNSLRLNLGK